jgi:hypothetical protein
MTISPLHISFDPGDLVVHHKTGNFYRILCFAKVEATLEDVVVYIEVSSKGRIWTRPKGEMFDGRFGWIQ